MGISKALPQMMAGLSLAVMLVGCQNNGPAPRNTAPAPGQVGALTPGTAPGRQQPGTPGAGATGSLMPAGMAPGGVPGGAPGGLTPGGAPGGMPPGRLPGR